MIGASIETTRELWASSLREVKKRIRPLFAQERAALNAGLFVDGLEVTSSLQPWAWPLAVLGGVLLLFATLHVARAVGHLHGQLAKHLLVKSAQYS